MSGNFGGNSLPTTLIDGATLYAGRNTTYKDWKCSSVLAGADLGDFTYDGTTYPIAANQEIQMVITPSELVEDAEIHFFLCYPCSCENPVVSPVVITTGDTNYQNYGPSNKPIIIGGGGLNS